MAKKFIEQYDLDGSRINDLKQIFSIVVWTKLQGYNLDCKLPLLQLVKYDVLYTWHEYVRTSCGVTFIPTDHAYRLIRKAAKIYYSHKIHDDGIRVVTEELKITEEKAKLLIPYANWFKYSESYDNLSAEDEFLVYEWRLNLLEAAKGLSPKEIQIIELTIGVCLDCLGLIEKKTYEQIALLQGVADASVIEKKRKKALKKYRELLL